MKAFRFLFFLLIAVAGGYGLDNKWGQIPPLGGFLDPRAGFWQNAEERGEQWKGLPRFRTLKEEVSVYVDSLQIPHIYANNEHDLYFVQGYITARERLFQMEFLTRAAAGRISEVVGADALPFDRMQRRQGLLYGAKQVRDSIERDPHMRRIARAYSQGVNAYIHSLDRADLPLEYKLLDHSPEEWRPLKTALLLQYMSNSLSGKDRDLELTNALKKLGEERFDLLFPERLPGNAPIIPPSKKWEFDPLPVDTPDQPLRTHYIQKPDTLPSPHPGNGSNNWAVSGTKTLSGNPILANDPHLPLYFPSIWFAVHLNAPDMNVMGVSLPGSPSVIIGFNDSLAWGITNAGRDTRDWYEIQYRGEEKAAYRYGDQWFPTRKKVEKFDVMGEDPVLDTITYTHYGPVVFDRSFPEDRERLVGYALKWSAHDPSNELRAFYAMNKAQDHEGFKEALRAFSRPAQNFAFATVEDSIGMWVQGDFQRKWEEQGRFLMDGRDPVNDRQGSIPFHHNPHVVNPDRGFVSSANQHPVDSTYPYYLNTVENGYYRARRIDQWLAGHDSLTPGDMKEFQTDVFSFQAKMVLPLLLDSLSGAPLDQRERVHFQRLKEWDHTYGADETAPVLFELWWRELYRSLWEEFRKDSLALPYPHSALTIHLLKEGKEKAFSAKGRPSGKEAVKTRIRAAFHRAADSIAALREERDSALTWWRFKGTRIGHLLRLPAFGSSELRVGGDRGIVNATSSRHGPSWRMVVELGEKVKAWGVYPGGQSGNPGSPYYDNMVEEWKEGQYFPLIFEEAEAFPDEALSTKVRLKPEKE